MQKILNNKSFDELKNNSPPVLSKCMSPVFSILVLELLAAAIELNGKDVTDAASQTTLPLIESHFKKSPACGVS